MNFFERYAQALPVFSKAERKHQGDKIANIGIDGSRYSGVLDFDGNALTGFQRCAMNLANRGGGERLFLEALKQIFRVAPEFIDQHFPNERVVHGRRVEVKTFEGGENFRGKNSGKA